VHVTCRGSSTITSRWMSPPHTTGSWCASCSESRLTQEKYGLHAAYGFAAIGLQGECLTKVSCCVCRSTMVEVSHACMLVAPVCGCTYGQPCMVPLLQHFSSYVVDAEYGPLYLSRSKGGKELGALCCAHQGQLLPSIRCCKYCPMHIQRTAVHAAQKSSTADRQ
jgi:hypothetical protein